MWRTLRAVLIGALCLSMCSCGWLGCRKKGKDYSKRLPEGQTALVKLTDPKDYPDFGTGFKNRDGLVEAIDHSLEYYKHPSSKQFYPYKVSNDPAGITHERAVATLETFKKVLGEAKDGADLHRILCERFDVYMSRGCDEEGTVLFTGYCTPIFKGSLQRSPDYNCPLYKRPPDLVTKPDGTPVGRDLGGGKFEPYPTRRDIETKQLLAGKGLELVYLRNPLEVHIAHVQGSAKIELPDNTTMNVGYAGKTDRPYISVGLSLVADKRIEPDELSLQKMIEYFDKHAHEVKSYVYRNDSYVFFTQRDGPAVGSLNVPVIPYRSIATDKAVFPRGLLSYVVTKVPRLQSKDKVTLEPFYAYTLDQDTGGAIRSAGRCDVYMGVGPDAMLLAGRTRAEGKVYYLAVK